MLWGGLNTGDYARNILVTHMSLTKNKENWFFSNLICTSLTSKQDKIKFEAYYKE